MNWCNANKVETKSDRHSLRLLVWLLGFLAASTLPSVCSGNPLFSDKSRSFYLKYQDQWTVKSQSSLDIHEALPIGTYTVGMYPTGEYYLKELAPFVVDQKLYGDTEAHAERILDTFRKREGSTGVLLAGEKGSGKTLLAKYISYRAAREDGIPTILINEPWTGEAFNAFIQSIQQPCIVLFDEFEKTYRMPLEAEMKKSSSSGRILPSRYSRGKEVFYASSHSGDDDEAPNPSQDAILTLLDGVYPSNMLFILTANDKSLITKNMMNRPGRILYALDFHGLESDFIREYCHDNLVNKTHTKEVVAYAGIFAAFSFDMLQALVQEMNTHNESTTQALQWLNVKPSGEKEFKKERYNIKKLLFRGEDMKKSPRLHSYVQYEGNPFADHFVKIEFETTSRITGSIHSHVIPFSVRDHMVRGNLTSGVYEFYNGSSRVVLERVLPHDPIAMIGRVDI